MVSSQVSARSTVAVLGVVATMLATAAPASGDGNASKHASSKSAPSAEYKKACDAGNAKYASRDFTGAVEQYRKAIELSPKQALAFYLMGEAQLAANSLTEAEAAWNRAVLESGEDDVALHAKALFLLADLKERQLKWDDARSAWQVYLDWANRYPSAGAFAGSAQSRLQVIDSMKKQDKAYEIVRQRIEETKAGNVFTDLSKPAPSAR
jgi:tetratricopeptide (TPR) repeat protein